MITLTNAQQKLLDNHLQSFTREEILAIDNPEQVLKEYEEAEDIDDDYYVDEDDFIFEDDESNFMPDIGSK